MTTFLTWFPRIVAFVFAFFISVFALDAWDGQSSFGHQLGHFLVHLLPTAAVLGALWLAWNRRILGGLVFMVLGMVFAVYFNTWRTLELFFMLSLPLLVAGVFFILSYLKLEKT